ncbi:MAG: PEP-CTERM sorting domain-containing protein [Fuerstiella sp.]|nr:PEP-CTERM sorting domain-containing protein [Fuerstiella sp.]
MSADRPVCCCGTTDIAQSESGGQYDELGEGALVGNFGGQDLFITYGGMGDGGGVALYTNAVPEPTTVLIWSMLAGLGMTVRRRR